MKIAFIGQKGLPAHYGGVERHVEELAARLVQAGHEVTVYSRKWYTGGQDGELNGVKIKHLPSLHTKHLDTITHVFLATLHSLFADFDVIHYHGIGPSLLSWLPRIFARQSLVVSTFHSIDRYHQKWNFLAKIILRLGEWAACTFPYYTITVSKSLRQYCLNEFNKKTAYIPNGVGLPGAVGEANLKKFNLEKNQYLVMISRLVPHKGAHFLITAFSHWQKEQALDPAVQNLKLVIVGGSACTDKYVKELHQLAAGNEKIIFTGFQSGQALKELYANALALVHPSLNEGLPLTVLEAMSYARPVLLSSIPEHRELLADNRLIFRENDVDDLQKKLAGFFSLSLEEKNKIGETNRRVVANNYNWDKLVKDTLAVYQLAKNQKPLDMPIISSLPS